MKLFRALILFLCFSAACGLKCYVCALSDPHSCTDVLTCPAGMDRCFSTVTKGCQFTSLCVSPMSCCEGNLCNSAIPTGPSVVLLLVSSAIITIFL
uniref:UPAR/Ly6 domain-containing protein n=1 Tax=Maylandia zebra TaxID=106582 RepID=A0A3P9BR46_9CICH